MVGTRTSYRLKRFESATDPDFAAAILVYVRNTAGSIRTESNQITSWLEAPPSGFKGVFYVFGFYLNEQLVAFAEASYFSHAELLMFDYLVIEESVRRNNIFFEFTDHLRQYFEIAHPEYRYVVAEVGYGPGEQFPSRTSQLIARLLKLQGFRVVKAPYFQPRLVWSDAETEMRADLLIFTDEPVDRIQRETYLRIVKAIYFDYYLPWMDTHTLHGPVYKKYLEQLFERIDRNTGRNRIIELNGHNVVLQPAGAKTSPRTARMIRFPIQALAVVVVLSTAMLILRHSFSLSDTSLAFVFCLAMLSYMATAGVVSKEARDMFERLASHLKEVFYRTGGGLKPSVKAKAVPGKRHRALPQKLPVQDDE